MFLPSVPLTPRLNMALSYTDMEDVLPQMASIRPRVLPAIILRVLPPVGTAENVLVHPLRYLPLEMKPRKLIVLLGVYLFMVTLLELFTTVAGLFLLLLTAGNVKQLRLVTLPPLGARLPTMLGL